MRAGASSPLGKIPVFSLYGEADAVQPEFIHVEDIRSRSESYGWEISGHRHHGLSQLLLLIEGSTRLRIESRDLTLDGPLAVVVPSGIVHAFQFTPGTHGYVLTIEDSVLAKGRRGAIDPSSSFAGAVIVDLASAAVTARRLQGLFEQIMVEFREGGLATSDVLRWLASTALVLVLREHDTVAREKLQGAGVSADFHRFRQMVEVHFASHWPVPHYAREMAVSESRLNRVCRAAAGKSALEIIQDRLTLEARRRLLHVAGTISSVAYDLGFEDPAYFWRFFRRRTGLTPTAFRRQQATG